MAVYRVVVRKNVLPHLETLAAQWGYENDWGEVVNLLIQNAALIARGECPASGMVPPAHKPPQASGNGFGIDISDYSL